MLQADRAGLAQFYRNVRVLWLPAEDTQPLAMVRLRYHNSTAQLMKIAELCKAPTPRLKALNKYDAHNVHRDEERYPQFNKS